MAKWSALILALLYFNVYTAAQEIKSIKTPEGFRSTPIELNVFKLEDKKNLKKDSVYNQAISYFAKPFGDKHGRSTNVHETIHGINNTISNLRKGYRAFFVGYGRAVWIKEPNITMNDIIPYIPQSVKGYRYDLYFVSQIKSWNNVALYPIDEWSAYIGGAESSVDDYHNQDFDIKTNFDNVSGSLEFSVYCIALSMAIKERDSNYWQENDNFKNCMILFLNKAEKVFFEGKDIFRSNNQNDIIYNLQTHKDCDSMRKFIYQEFNGIFLR